MTPPSSIPPSSTPPSATTPSSPARPVLAGSAVLDVAAVAVFIAVGRYTHDDAASVIGYLNALWPFLAGLAVGWLICLAAAVRRPRATTPEGSRWAPHRVFPAGVVIWVSTVAVGMALRWVVDQGVATAFVVVASIATAVLLLGWRVITLILGGRRIRG